MTPILTTLLLIGSLSFIFMLLRHNNGSWVSREWTKVDHVFNALSWLFPFMWVIGLLMLAISLSEKASGRKNQ